MTRNATARVAGVTYLLYIALGVTAMFVGGTATGGDGSAARLASMADHAGAARLDALLGMLIAFVALALAVSLWAITRDEDRDLAAFALACRVAEAVVGVLFVPWSLGLLALATTTDPGTSDSAALQATAAGYFAATRWNPVFTATFFAVGSAVFCWLLLRGRMIPAGLAWLGLLSSLVLTVALPLQMAALLRGAPAQLVWIPMAIFECVVALWFIAKGVQPPARLRTVPES